MSGVRDPAFWKRFSVAVHMDDEEALKAGGNSELKESNQWLRRTNQKNKNKYACICWSFWICFAAIIAGVIIAVIILINDGTFAKIHIGS